MAPKSRKEKERKRKAQIPICHERLHHQAIWEWGAYSPTLSKLFIHPIQSNPIQLLAEEHPITPTPIMFSVSMCAAITH